MSSPLSPLHPRDSREVPLMHQRSIHHDYHGRGIYLITLCTEGRRPLLGRLTGSSLDTAAIEPTALGSEVLRCWEQIPSLQRQLAAKKSAKTGEPCVRDITLLDYQLMPDHFHGIIFVRQEMDIALGDVIRGFMIGCTKAFNKVSPQICGAPNQTTIAPSNAPSQETAAPYNAPSQETAACSAPTQETTAPCSAPNQTTAAPYNAPSQETAAPSNAPNLGTAAPCNAPNLEANVVGCRAYSRGAASQPPLRPLWEKGYHDRLLLHSGQLQNMIDYVRDNPRRLMLRRQHRDLFLVQRHVRYAHWTFSSIGQLSLLDAPLVAVHVRRYFNDEQRRDYMNGCILAARRGAVLVSPFISEHEKRVREEALHEGLFCIQLCAEPFSDYHKPPGELISHCANGHLLLLTLTAGNPQERRITRNECSSLNAVAESMARRSKER